MAHVYRETRTLTRTFTKRDPNGMGRVTTKPAEIVTVDLEIDIDALFNEVGGRAARSTGGKSVIGSGMVVARRRRS